MILISEYFDGSVKSLGYDSKEGKSTIGVIEKGEYKFGTSMHETMIIIEGELEALLPESAKWETFTSGQSFEVSANQSFTVRSGVQTSYLCKYR
jgi:uncharacterized protein YaiE (UPF0345 family)